MNTWNFAIDVGGTFTDCLARRPDGELVHHKLLSTGVYRVQLTAAADGTRARLPDTVAFPKGFLVGYAARFGNGVPERRVLRHEGDQLHFDGALPMGAANDLVVELASPETAPVTGIRWLMGKSLSEPIGAVTVRLGTTRGTNALLTRTGARVALVTTAGFADVLEIAYQNRPQLFALDIKKPLPLYDAVVEADERLDADGRVLKPLAITEIQARLTELRAQGIQSLAICLLHGYRNPVHEELIAELARALGFAQVSLSSQVSPLQRIVPRGDTTVVDAYLTPVIRAYVDDVRRSLPDADLKLMTSAGGLVAAASFAGKDSILSGPAGGVVGIARVAHEVGETAVIGFDMGGTSTDVSRYGGALERRFETELADPARGAGVRLAVPMLAIETVAAGGGSICAFDGVRLTVGPASAGADPGPACYGKGGPLTLTDLNLLLGRIPESGFALPLSRAAAAARLDELTALVNKGDTKVHTPEDIASGCLAIAASTMAEPIKKVSLARGYDVRRHALVSFGGAGAQHACQVASALGIRRIIQHPQASYLSAYGIGVADVRKQAVREMHGPLGEATMAQARDAFETMRAALTSAMSTEGYSGSLSEIRSLGLRYVGQDAELSVEEPSDGDYLRAFVEAHRRQYGFVFPGRGVEARNARLELVAKTEPPLPKPEVEREHVAQSSSLGRAWFDGRLVETPVYDLASLSPGARLSGPALITGADTTVVVEPSWDARLSDHRILILTERGQGPEAHESKVSVPLSHADPIQLALFQNQITGIAEQMGTTLRRTSLSVNVKERLDFSCAVFAADGALVVNAPHIPVHLGSMGDTVRAVIRDAGAHLKPGDVFVTNDPYDGGSHLPDVTVIAPVFSRDGKRLLFFTGNRAHHAEIGGLTPGSMPPTAKSLAEEGVLIRNFRLVSNGVAHEDELRQILTSGPYPSRAPDDNLADLRAQIAANELGRVRLLELVEQQGEDYVTAYMGHIRSAATRLMRQALRGVKPGRYEFHDAMDDGTAVAVAITISHGAPSDPDGAQVVCDFTGTGPVAAGNLNANAAIVKAAVLYVFRCLVGSDVPLNEGVLDPVQLIIPKPSLLAPPGGSDPTRMAAVNAGNVETSQRLVDVLLGALGLAAGSQGTMNNLLFGRTPTADKPGFGYYETVAGGAGAGPGFAGASAVHTHMTNTRITDPEVLEERFPVRLLQFSIRRGSGGKGRYDGGDGIIREIQFLAPLTLSLITSRRVTVPYGLAGGEPGKPGLNTLIHEGRAHPLAATCQTQVVPGDILRLETPGGGAYGAPQPHNQLKQ